MINLLYEFKFTWENISVYGKIAGVSDFLNYQRLSGFHFSGASVILPLYPDMFGICDSGFTKIRIVQRRMVSNKTRFTVSSLGRKRIRSGSVNFLIEIILILVYLEFERNIREFADSCFSVEEKKLIERQALKRVQLRRKKEAEKLILFPNVVKLLLTRGKKFWGMKK